MAKQQTRWEEAGKIVADHSEERKRASELLLMAVSSFSRRRLPEAISRLVFLPRPMIVIVAFFSSLLNASGEATVVCSSRLYWSSQKGKSCQIDFRFARGKKPGVNSHTEILHRFNFSFDLETLSGLPCDKTLMEEREDAERNTIRGPPFLAPPPPPQQLTPSIKESVGGHSDQ
ncbi:unnamed protein product [Cyprideis torosa]|uniref:Uncharacterized protein n=1 Tax=Cyprideis torosa TaxID=163714 RepID=A0A7R8W1Q2_9CRUS|nr:unnamed protein product [Cyprideis torosa]CAG0881179.1 unnamed protein product [Cyprideis torosa]